MSTEAPIAFSSLPADAFPFTVEFISHDTGQVVHTIDVPEPGVLRVPPLRDEHGPVWARISYANGTVVEVEYATGLPPRE
jgi:hypothetical protein